MKNVHRVARVPCPAGCGQIFRSQTYAKSHVKSVHGNTSIPCPDGCEKTFHSTVAAMAHSRKMHRGARVQCPEGCDRSFHTVSDANIHVNFVHHGIRYPCPYNCGQSFTTPSNARSHAENMHFKPDTILYYICMIPNCVSAVQRRLLPRGTVYGHIKRHEERGQQKEHLNELSAYEKVWIDRPPERYLPSSISRLGDRVESPEAAADSATNVAFEDNLIIGAAEALMDEDDKEDSDSFLDPDIPETFFLQHNPSSVRAYNQKILSKFHHNGGIQLPNVLGLYPKARLVPPSRGQCCIGPQQSVLGMVVETCPQGTVITDSTAYLNEPSCFDSAKVLSYSPRCCACHISLTVQRSLRRAGFPKQPDQGHCTYRSCVRSNVNGFTLCARHLIAKTPLSSSNDDRPINEQLTAALSHGWEHDDPFRHVCEVSQLIAEGRLPQGRLVCVDLEYSSRSRKIFEIGVCEYVSGKTVINCRVWHSCTFDELIGSGVCGKTTADDHGLQAISKAALKVYGLQDTPKNGEFEGAMKSSNFSTARDVARGLQHANVTPQTTVIAWATNRSDLRILREFLAEDGCLGILPQDDKCFLPLFHYGRKLPKLRDGSKFPLKQDVLFPLLFPGHDLVGFNHRALADALQLRLITKKLEDAYTGKVKRQEGIEKWFKRDFKVKDVS